MMSYRGEEGSFHQPLFGTLIGSSGLPMVKVVFGVEAS